MKICSKNNIRTIAGIMAATLLLGGCTVTSNPNNNNGVKDPPNLKTEIKLDEVSKTDYDQELMDGLYRKYCFDLFSQTVRDYGSEENVMISPASVMIALDMVAAGAKEDSLKQLTDLFAAGQGPLTQQAYAAALMDKINGSKSVEFSCANAVWSNETILGDTVNKEYVSYIQDTFNAEYHVSKFSSKTSGEINKWVDKHTDHMIKKVIGELDPSTVMVLVNAIAFDGKWAVPYEEYQVKDGDFTRWDGTVQTVKYLHGGENTYYETEKATGFRKSYEGGQYSFIAILPTDESISANEFVRNFTAEDYEDFIGSVSYEYDVFTTMPEFSSDFEFLLNGTLENLGAGDVFHTEKADLSGIAGNPGDLYVSKVIHKTHIEVDANGTKAAAVTAISLDAGSAMPIEKEFKYVECVRPFVYAIVDNETNAPVFIGTVNEV
ncbi:MAG: serpin family protein [Lachnospiraceae bacterium]|nr:serpin family protein [Lachnospiraceae bacterium]